MLPEIGGKWGTECLDTMFPLPTLLCAGFIYICIGNTNMYVRNLMLKTETLAIGTINVNASEITYKISTLIGF